MGDFDEHNTPDSVELSWCPFSVQIYGIPLGMMNEKVAYASGRSIGNVIEVDNGGDKIAWGRCLRVRILINVHKALKSGTKVSDMKDFRIFVLYVGG